MVHSCFPLLPLVNPFHHLFSFLRDGESPCDWASPHSIVPLNSKQPPGTVCTFWAKFDQRLIHHPEIHKSIYSQTTVPYRDEIWHNNRGSKHVPEEPESLEDLEGHLLAKKSSKYQKPYKKCNAPNFCDNQIYSQSARSVSILSTQCNAVLHPLKKWYQVFNGLDGLKDLIQVCPSHINNEMYLLHCFLAP